MHAAHSKKKMNKLHHYFEGKLKFCHQFSKTYLAVYTDQNFL